MDLKKNICKETRINSNNLIVLGAFLSFPNQFLKIRSFLKHEMNIAY